MESAKDLGILEEILDDAGIDTKTTKEPIVLSEYVSTPLQACLE
jgi:hypothetical protein